MFCRKNSLNDFKHHCDEEDTIMKDGKFYVDPFCPNVPLDDPSLFEGRTEEIKEIINALYQTYRLHPQYLMITGDRGIGKSSLLYQTKLLATGNNKLADKFGLSIGKLNFDFVTIWHDSDHDQTLNDVVEGLLEELKGRIESIIENFTFDIDLGGILKISKKEEKSHTISNLVKVFCKHIKKASDKIAEEKKDGIIIFIDEMDRLPQDCGIASFMKLVVERINREGIKNVGFVCAGITGVVQKLEVEHESILRTFREIPIARLDEPQSTDILKVGFETVSIGYNAEIFNMVFKVANGFPEPVHLLGSEMLNVDKDDYLDKDDFNKALKKVVTMIRKNELGSLLEKAGFGKYQKILKAMADYIDSNVPLEHISNVIGLKQNEYSANIGKLIERNIIHRVDKGVYCFTEPLLKEYIHNFGIIENRTDTEEIEG